jgi:hypothetical protein
LVQQQVEQPEHSLAEHLLRQLVQKTVEVLEHSLVEQLHWLVEQVT